MEENDKTLSTTARSFEVIKEKNSEPNKDNSSSKDEEIIGLLLNIDIDSQDLFKLINNLISFNFELKSIKNIELILTKENLNIFKKLSSKENIKINLILSKIYMNIINNESLYTDYLLGIKEEKTNLIIQIIEDCISLIQKLNGFIFDSEIFNFKQKTLSLIKCFYYNCKGQIKNDISSQKLSDLLDSFPTQFFSETYNDLNKDKELYEIFRSGEQEKIYNFEDKFAQINNYYEQYDAFRRFVECNSGVVTYASVGGEVENYPKKEEIKNGNDKIEFYQKYGLLILKFCKYHQYIFLNKENNEAENKEKKENEEEQENIRVVFLLDKIKEIEEEEKVEEEKKEEEKKEEKKKEEEQGNKKIENIMKDKIFVSLMESKEYNELIKKEINNYLNFTKSFENVPKIKNIREQMSYFLSIIDVDSYVPLYLTDYSKITISDNFTPSFVTNVPAGKTKEFYLETKKNETMLIYIEFSLEDKSKDITFEVNKYEISSNSFKPIFKEEKVEDIFKFFILCNGYSLYQIVFNNYYSWFTSKDINYRIDLLKLIDKSKVLNLGHNEEKEKGKEKENDKEKGDEKEKEDEKENDKEKEDEKEKEDKKDNDKEKEKENEKENDKEKEELIIEYKEKEDEKLEENFNCNINGKNICFNQNEISEKIKDLIENKDDNEINIPIILYLNNLRIVSIQKEGITFIETIEDDENFIPKHCFNFTLINYLKKNLKIKPAEAKNKKITISLFSQNRDLSEIDKEVDDQIKSLSVPSINSFINDSDSIQYYKKIGFYPSELLEGYKVEYKLYDLCEQSLIYYLYLSYLKKSPPKKSVLFIGFDKLVVNAAIFHDGNIYNQNKEKDIKISNINTNDVNGIIDFIENINDTYEGFDIVLSYVNIDEEKKEKMLELFDNTKKHCQEKINPPIKVLVYDQNEIANNVFNYMNLFYDN